MGLDITAYSKLQFVKPWSDEMSDEERDKLYDKYVCIYPPPSFKERMQPLVPGFYKANGSEHNFRAGSYSGYNNWRDYLAQYQGLSARDVWSNRELYKNVYFYDLIDFSDCEGIIGAEAADRLHKQFVEKAKTFQKWLKSKDTFWFDYNWQLYKDWTKAFRLAKNNGAVVFH